MRQVFGFFLFVFCCCCCCFFSYFSSFLASFPLILLPTINLSLLQHCTCKFCTYMYCIFFIVDHIQIFFIVHAFNLPVSTLLFNSQDKGKVQWPPASLQSIGKLASNAAKLQSQTKVVGKVVQPETHKGMKRVTRVQCS